MLREYKRLLDAMHLAATGCLIVLAYVVLHGFMRDRPVPLEPFHQYLSAIAIFVSAVIFALARRRFSALDPLARPGTLLRELGLCYGLGMLAYGFSAYTFKLPHLSRMYLFGSMAWSFALSSAWHLGAYAFYRWMHARGWNIKRALLIGEGRTLPEVAHTIRSNNTLGLRIAGTLALDSPEAHRRSLNAKSIGALLDSMVVDYAIFAAYRSNPDLAETVMLCCQERGIEIWLRPDFIHQEVVFSRFDYLQDIPMFVFSMTPREGAAMLIKRLFDMSAALIMLVVLAAPMLLMALLIRQTSPGPALFRQPRIGLNGRKFLMYKFRSMRDGVPSPDAGGLPNALKGPVFKMTGDPRITPVGSFLRKYSLDELPQFWNVLVGDMSLVGPRPPLPSEVNRYQGWQRRRLSMRPGITGLWQASGRNAIVNFDDWVKLDLRYIDDWSLWLDLKILLMTVPAVVKGTGV